MTNKNLSFQHQTILVTGGTSGIGLATVQAFLEQGAARVYVTGRDMEKLQKVQASLGERVIGINLDVSETAQFAVLRDTISNHQDQLDVVFVNAGVAENNTLGDTSEQQFDRMFDTNVKGVFFTVQTVLPLIKQDGNIILNASVAANKGMSGLSVYSATKAAVRSLARTLCNELKEQKIRVNTISPGVTKTPILQNGLKMSEQNIQEFEQFLQATMPAGRMAEASEIANAVLFLASAAASYVNGVELSVDGGFTQI